VVREIQCLNSATTWGSMSTRVVASFDNPAGDHCVDIFVREDSTFGFEEYRRDVEDLSGWFSLHRYAHQIFATEQEAMAQARATVAWMATVKDEC
jgi:hypothetical protein